MLDHVTFGVSEIRRSQAFYDRALRPLGIERLYTEDDCAGYGANDKAFFWIGLKGVAQTGAQPGAHVAFATPDRETVDRFYQAALAAGGKDNGAPGLRRRHQTASRYLKDFGVAMYCGFGRQPGQDGDETMREHSEVIRSLS